MAERNNSQPTTYSTSKNPPPARGGGGIRYGFEKPKAPAGQILLRLIKYLGAHKWLLILAIGISLVSNLLALIGPKLSGYAIDALELGEGAVDFDTVIYYVILMIVGYVLSAILSYVLTFVMVQIGRNTVYRMRKEVFEHLLRLPISFYDNHQVGDILSVMNYDIDNISTALSNDLVHIFTSLVTVVFSFVMMLTISPIMILIFLVTIPISVIFTRYRTNKVRPMFRTRSQKLGALNSYAEEMTGGLATIKAYGREDVFNARFDEYNESACEANYQADRFASTTGPAVMFINNISLALVSIFGAFMYMSGVITIGNVSSFVLYSRKFSGPINEFANIFSELQSAMASAERVFRLLDEPTEPEDKIDAIVLTNPRGEVELKDVHFSYVAGAPVLNGVSLKVNSGQTVAIVGHTGSGKTTIISLLMRFYDVDAGAIYIDGVDVRDLTRDSLRSAFSMVLQDTWLFSDTILNNLRYGREDVTDEEIYEAAKATSIDKFIKALPNGYDTILSDGGASISKGQKQLLTIARAMLSDAPMLILDEATSNVDSQTEIAIQSAILKLRKNKTCFVIAHRLSTIKNADLIVVMKEGRIVESGTHEELIARGGYYYELHNSQFVTDTPLAIESERYE